MKLFIGGLIGLMLSVSVDAEPLLKGQVRLSSGQSAADIQVRLFDLTDLRRFVGTKTDEAGYFALPLKMFSMNRGTALPTNFALGQNYPNPFNPSTVIPYQIPASSHVRLEVFNLLGQRLATLVDAERSAGAHTAQWDATDAAGRAVGAGVYIYRLSGSGVSVSRRMVLVDGQAGIPAVGVTTQGRVQSAVEGSVEADGSVYGLVVSGQGLVPYVDPTFRIGADEVAIVIEPYDGTPRMKITTSEILGDVDGNGRVDIIDALLVAMYSVDSSIPADHIPNIALGDVDADGDIDFTDAYLIGTYSVNPLDPMLPPGIGQAAPTSVEPDTALSHMYWADANPDKIQRANLDGSNIKDLLPGLESPVGMALDVTGGKMYWTDRDAGVVQRTNLDGSTTEILITGLETPIGIALDGDEGKIYWTDRDAGVVQRANLDGSNVETLVTGVRGSEGIALDVAGGKMYWTNAVSYKIQRANLDGSNIETLITGLETPVGIALDGDGGKIYWTDRDAGVVQRANLDGSNVETLITGVRGSEGIALDVIGGKICWADAGSDVPGTGKIQRANLDGSNIETLITGLETPVGIALDGDRGKIYWTDAGSVDALTGDKIPGTGAVQRANLDGSNIETIVTELKAPNTLARIVLSGRVVAPFGIALDMDGGKIYWMNEFRGMLPRAKIQRANLDGSNIETLVTRLISPFGITLDGDGGKIYWTDANGTIQRANLDGSNIKTLVPGVLGVASLGIALDLAEGRMYWTDVNESPSGTGAIQRANLDGSNIETLVTELETPVGIALDGNGGKMYWTNAGSVDVFGNKIPGTGAIQRANLDGSNIETLVTEQEAPFGIALDVDGDQLYWTDAGTGAIQRANLDGSNIETLVTGLKAPTSIVIAP